MADKTERRSWLENLLAGALGDEQKGKQLADEVRRDAQAATSALDKLGLARREEMPMEVVEEKPIAVALAQAITEAVAGDYASLTPERLAEILASIIPGEAEMAEEEVEPEATPPAADAPPKDEEEEEAAKAILKSLNEQSAFIVKATADMGAIAQDVVALKSLADKVQGIEQSIATIQATLSARPRQSSQAEETVIEAATEAARKVQKQIEGENITTELGFRVRKTA